MEQDANIDIKHSLRKYNWRVSHLLRGILYAKKCDVCGKITLRLGKRAEKIIYLSKLLFWGVPIENQDFICKRCKKQVLIVSPNTEELVILDKPIYKELSKDSIGRTLFEKAKGTIVVIATENKLLGNEKFSLTISKVLFQCLISEHNLGQVLKRYGFIKE